MIAVRKKSNLNLNISRCFTSTLVLLACLGLQACAAHKIEVDEKEAKFESKMASRRKCKASEPRATSIKNIDAFLINKKKLPNKKFDFSFLDLNIREALLEVSQQSGVPIVFDEAVNGPVSIVIQQKTLIESLKMIVEAGPFDFKQNEGFLYVGSIAESNGPSWNKLSTLYPYRTKNLAPSILHKMLSPEFQKMVTVDDSRRMMTVSAPRSFLVKIIKLLDQLDVVQRQVLLRVTISEVSERGKHEIGQILPQDQNFNGFSTSAYTLTSIGYQRFIKALLGLQNNGQATIKAQPNVVVYEGEKALFNSSSTKYSKASPGIPQNSISTGLKLNITPFVSDQSNEVTLVIDESKLGDITNQLDDDTIVDNSITTKVRVKIGEALVFGGMFTKKERTIETKVPVLGNFPLIGQFFKNKNSSEEMNEVVFTVQPEILCD